jgi:DNA-binding response OmpR family regulator
MTGEANTRVVLAEDDRELRALVALWLRHAGYTVIEAPDGRVLLDLIRTQAMGIAGSDAFDLVISDVRMPGSSGLDVLHAVRGISCDVPFVLITAFSDSDLKDEAHRLGAFTVLEKPFDVPDLLAAVRGALGRA